MLFNQQTKKPKVKNCITLEKIKKVRETKTQTKHKVNKLLKTIFQHFILSI